MSPADGKHLVLGVKSVEDPSIVLVEKADLARRLVFTLDPTVKALLPPDDPLELLEWNNARSSSLPS